MGERTAERDAAACVERGHGPVLVRSVHEGPEDLVGHSHGALLCLLPALRRPELVRSLVLVEPPAWSLFVSDPPRPAELLRPAVSRPRTAAAAVAVGARGLGPARKATGRGDPDRAIHDFGRAVLGDDAFRDLSRRRWRQVLDNNLRAEHLTADFLPLRTADLHRVRLPVLLVTGQRSPRMFHRLAEGLQEVLPRCRRVEIPGASHLVHEDDAPAFDAVVEEFLREAGTAP